MKINKKLHSLTLVSAALILFLILVSSTASIATAQSASQVGTYAYITNSASNTVSVIDTATNKVTVTVPVVYGPCGVAVTPDGKKVYVANSGSNTISVIDTAKNEIIYTIYLENFDGTPYGGAASPDGKKVYMLDGDQSGKYVLVIDTAKNKVIDRVFTGGSEAGKVAVSPDGSKLYVTMIMEDCLNVIDTDTDHVTVSVPVGAQPDGISVSSDGQKVYVANYWDNTTSVIDTATNIVTATVNVGTWPQGVAVNPAGTKVYVTNSADKTVSVIDTATNKVTATVPVGSQPGGISITFDGKKVYVANSGSNTISVIDTATNKVTDNVKVGNRPVAVGMSIGVSKIPVAAFSGSPISGKAPLTVKFTDKSTGSPTSWSWNFGDKNTSIAQNPTHKYTKAGKYTVSLTVKNAAGSNTTTKSSYVNVVTVPVASFSASPTFGKAPLKVQFTDKSTGTPTSWKWSFGDKTYSTAKNPVHKYTAAGKYTVSLIVKNAAGSNTKTMSGYIKVSKK